MSPDPTPSQPTEEGIPTLPGQGRPGTLQPSSIDAIAPGPKVEAGFDPPALLTWFGVGGGAGAWALEHVVGIGFGLVRCFPTGTGSGAPRNSSAVQYHLPLSPWAIAAAACATLVTLAAIAVCVWIFLRTFRIGDVAGMERRGDGAPPPAGRLQFLAMCGLCVNVLALAIIVLSGVGAPILHNCQQS